jgi:hypothetical protein
MLKDEKKHLYATNFLEKMTWTHVNGKHRKIAIDWLVQLYEKLEFE